MYFISSGEVGHVHTYDRVSVGEYNKNRGYQGQKSAIDRRVIGSHTNPVSITYLGGRGCVWQLFPFLFTKQAKLESRWSRPFT